MSVILRDYQDKAVSDIRTAFMSNRRVLFVLPTGGGKTVVFSYIAQNAAQKGNVQILAHRAEITNQISRSLNSFGVSHGLIMPKERQTYDMAQVGMVQTVARRLERVPKPNLLIIDEAHHAVAGSWEKVTAQFPEAKILGVTATPQRLDGRGLIKAFDTLVIGPTVRELIASGYLSAFDLYAPPTSIDLSEVHTQMGDYAIKEIEKIMDKATVTGSAVTHYQKYLNGKPAIAFCTTIAHAEHVRDQFRAAGWRSESIDGKLNATERESRVEQLGNGHIHVLTSCEIVSEGFDISTVSGAILLRPTKSLSLYLQQVGRALRPKPDGGRAVLLDHVGNVHRHGMPDEDRAWTLEGKIKKVIKSPSQCKRCYRVFYGKPNCDDILCPSKISPADKTPPQEVDGELRQMQDPYAWAMGISIASARGDEWKSLLHHASGRYDRLKQIAAIRAYKGYWIKKVMEEWRRKM